MSSSYPKHQTQLCHSGHGHRDRAAQVREAVEQCHAHLQFCDLTLKRSGHDPLTQTLETMHLGLHQAPAVVAAPLLPDGAPQPSTGLERVVAHTRPLERLLPRLAVLARRNYGLHTSFCNRLVACTGVIGTIGADAGNGLFGRYLRQQLWQHGRISHRVVRHFNSPNLHRVRINAQVQGAPLPAVLSPVFLALPLPLAQEFDARAVHQQIERTASAVGQLHFQRLLEPTLGAEVGHLPVQLRQPQQALNRAQTLVQGQGQGQVEEAFDAQAELDRCLGKIVQPHRQGPSGLDRSVVRRTVRGLVAHLRTLGLGHELRLPHEVPLCATKPMVCVQRNDLLGRERVGQGGAPALQHILGQQHLLALFVDGAFGQPVHAPRSQHVIAMPELNTVCPQALALALTQLRPSGAGIGGSVPGHRLHRRRAWVPLDDEGDLPLQGQSLFADSTHELSRVLCAGAQGQLQAKALRAQVGCQWAVAIHPRIGAAHMLFDCPSVGTSEGFHIQRHVPAGQHTEVNGFAADLHAQYGSVDPIGQVEPRSMRWRRVGDDGTARKSRARAKKASLRWPSMASKSFLPRHNRPR